MPWSKAAKVELVSYEKTGGGYVTAVVRGDVAAVKAAIAAGIHGAEKVGEVIATHVIARPHLNVDLVLPLGPQDAGPRRSSADRPWIRDACHVASSPRRAR